MKYVVLAALMALPLSSANAGIFGSVLTFDGVEDELLDESRTAFVDQGALGVFDVGDRFFGFASISDVAPQGGLAPNEIAIFYSFEVKADLGGGLFNLGAVTSGTETLASLLPDFAPVTNGLGDAAFVILANDGSYDPLVGIDATQANFATKFTSANWTYQGTGGFGTGTDDYLQFQQIGLGSIIGSQTGGFSLFDADFLNPGVQLIDVASTHFDSTPFDLTDDIVTLHNVTLENATIFNGAGSGWYFKDTANFVLNPVPEPTSVFVFAGIAALTVVRRRK